jgi:integrase
MGYYLGLRKSELRAPNLTGVTITEDKMTLKYKSTKNSGPRKMILWRTDPIVGAPDRVWKLWKSFFGQGMTVAKDAVDNVNILLGIMFPPKAGEHFTFHSFRHGKVTHLYDTIRASHGEKLRAIADFGYWKSTSTVEMYIH